MALLAICMHQTRVMLGILKAEKPVIFQGLVGVTHHGTPVMTTGFERHNGIIILAVTRVFELEASIAVMCYFCLPTVGMGGFCGICVSYETVV